jgi:peptidoglycan/LPS O-acetylase OafA/YrhL
MNLQHGARELPNLDLLRSLAVLLVASGHTFMYGGRQNWCGWGGLTGVSMFFVHTCLVLMFSLERDPHVGRFYVRRAFRIYPLWLVILALTILVKLPISPAYAPTFRYYAAPPMEVLNNVFLTFNLFCLHRGSPVFQTGANIVGASWSLAVEMQMYLFLPVLFFFIRSVRRLWPLLMLDIFIIAYNRMTLGADNSSLQACVPFFLPGVMAYVLLHKQRPIFPSWIYPIYLLSYIALHYRYGTLRATCFFCLFLGLTQPLFQQVTWKPLLRTAHLIARYSYGIYLCHMGAIVIGFYYLRNCNRVERAAGYLAFMIAAPVFFYHTVEKPMIVLGSKLARRIERGREPAMTEEALSLEPVP